MCFPCFLTALVRLNAYLRPITGEQKGVMVKEWIRKP